MFRHWRDLQRNLLFEEVDMTSPPEDLENAEGAVIQIPDDLTALTDEELNELRVELRDGFTATRESSPLDVALLERYAETARAVAAELTARAEARIDAENRAEELEAEIFAEVEGEEAPAEEGGSEGEGADGEEAETEEETEESADESADEPAEEEARVPVPVAASTVRPAEITRTLPRRARPLPVVAQQQYMTASGGDEAGSFIDRMEIPGLVREVMRGHDAGRFARYAAGGEAHAERHPLLRIEKNFPEDLKIGPNVDVLEVLDRAADPSRLPGGSLTAAGWCAPTETIYDLCQLESAEGLISVPEVALTRGGLKHTLGPDFGTLFTSAGFVIAADDVDTATKTCFDVVCPSFDEDTWALVGVCITADLLMRQAFPELIDRYINGSLVAHQHRLATQRILAIVAGSTAEVLEVPAGSDGSAAPLLSAIELAAEKIRYRSRMSRSALLEVVLPAWVEANIRADIAYREGKASLSVSDAEIASWFADRKVAPQFVYNWQNLVDTAGIGYPSTVQFLIYPAGTWVGASDEIIRLDVLYDSTLLSTNEYTALFTEEAWLMAKRCHDSRVVTTPICADGAVGRQHVFCAQTSP